MTISLPAGTPSAPRSEAALAGWRAYLSGATSSLDLPTDRPVLDLPHQPASVPVAVRPPVFALIDGVGEHGWLVAFGVLLHRFTGQREVVIATRQGDGALAHRISLSGQDSFGAMASGYTGPGLPPLCVGAFAELLHPGRPGATPFSAAVVRGTEPWPAARLTVLVSDAGEVRLGYDAAVIDERRAVRIAAHLARLFESIAEDPEERIGRLEVLPAAERERVLVGFNDTAVEYADQRSFEQRVADLAAAGPEALAVTYRDEQLTYAELDGAADRLANDLIAHDVAPGDVVALLLERSPAAVVATLAVLRAGAVVVPLDPADDDDWNAYMIRDSEPAAVITDSGLAGRLRSIRTAPDGRPVIRVDTDAARIAARQARRPGVETGQDAVSHIVYTSGTTGLPKGARGTHRAMVNMMNWMAGAYGITRRSAGTWISSPGFAIGRMEWMPFLAAGARLHIADAVTTSAPDRLRDWLLDRGATHTLLVTSLARRVCVLPWPEETPLRHMIVLGEPVRRWPGAALPFEVSVSYGSTETAVATCGYDEATGLRETSVVSRGAPSAGRPVANARVYLLDAHRAPVPVASIGEIFVAGAGLCAGYLNLPDETGKRFVPNPLPEEPDEVLFRTGDLGRWLPDGRLEVVGRQDAQTWVRGVLVELGRVEAVLTDDERIAEAAVLAGDGERLVAYAVPADGARWTPDEVLATVRARLPEHQVPQDLVALRALPRLTNGKLDRRALPAPT